MSLRVFYPDAISAREIADYNEVFEFWLDIWTEIRKGADAALDTPSDSFSRQSEILVLYDGRTPVATCCHRYVDLRHACVLHDSYFDAAIWPEHVKAMIPSFGPTAVLGSHIFIRPEYRKCQSGLPLKQIVCALALAHLHGTKPDVLLGMVRIDRGLDKVFQDNGAISLVSEVIWWYHIQVGLIALFPACTPFAINPAYREVVESIGRTCDRFGRNYFERGREVNDCFNGGARVTRA